MSKCDVNLETYSLCIDIGQFNHNIINYNVSCMLYDYNVLIYIYIYCVSLLPKFGGVGGGCHVLYLYPLQKLIPVSHIVQLRKI